MLGQKFLYMLQKPIYIEVTNGRSDPLAGSGHGRDAAAAAGVQVFGARAGRPFGGRGLSIIVRYGVELFLLQFFAFLKALYIYVALNY